MFESPAGIAAALALLIFILSKIYEWSLQRHQYHDNRRAAIVRFQVDMMVRDEDLQSKKVAFSDISYQSRMTDLIKEHAADRRPFRFYGVAVTDTKAQEEISHIGAMRCFLLSSN